MARAMEQPVLGIALARRCGMDGPRVAPAKPRNGPPLTVPGVAPATIARPLPGCTVGSASPWKTMVGGDPVAAPARVSCAPVRMTFNALIMSCAAPCGSPECTPTAA